MIFLVALVIGAKFSRSITHPIAQLIKKMRNIEKGDLDKLEEAALGNIPVSPQNEVGLLHRTFKMMLQRIRELIDENYAKQLVIRETELKALQAQINPHFYITRLNPLTGLPKCRSSIKSRRWLRHLASFCAARSICPRNGLRWNGNWISCAAT